MKTKVLIAIPTARYVEPQTFKSIYDLEIPDHVETTFQFFYGYRVDQVRNLIADWTIKGGFHYLFAVDHDITFPPDTLKKLLLRNVPLVSGVYRQRNEQQTLELYGLHGQRLTAHDIWGETDLMPIRGCGFGCVLVKCSTLEAVGYPQFEYHHALDHKDTFSEDMDFCQKAKSLGVELWVDPTVICDHIGDKVYKLEFPKSKEPPPKKKDTLSRYKQLRSMMTMPQPHIDLLKEMKEGGFEPTVILDIGASVLHWYDIAKETWPNAKIHVFDAIPSLEELYRDTGIPQSQIHMGILSDKPYDDDDAVIHFYYNENDPGGSSYYREIGPSAEMYSTFLSDDPKWLDQLRQEGILGVDLIKIDVQGAELDVLEGGLNILWNTPYLIIETRNTEYNKGAPSHQEVHDFLTVHGFELVKEIMNSGPDSDYLYFNSRAFAVDQ